MKIAKKHVLAFAFKLFIIELKTVAYLQQIELWSSVGPKKGNIQQTPSMELIHRTADVFAHARETTGFV